MVFNVGARRRERTPKSANDTFFDESNRDKRNQLAMDVLNDALSWLEKDGQVVSYVSFERRRYPRSKLYVVV